MIHITKYCLMALSILISTNTVALPDDFQQKLSIEADKFYLSEKEGSAIYEGNVVVQQGSIYISASKLTIHSSNNSKKYNLITAEGNKNKAALFRQTLDTNGNKVSGQGEKISYNTISSILEITGNGTIQKAEDVISADFIKYFMKSNVFEAKKENSGGRVSITLQPGNSTQQGQ